jgi:hypothetical protein
MDTLDKNFQKAVDEQDLIKVRIMLANNLIYNPASKEVDAMLRCAEEKFYDLYEKHDGGIFNDNSELWSIDLLSSVHNEIEDNFSKERWRYMRNLAIYVLKDRIAVLQKEEKEENECAHRVAYIRSKEQKKKRYTGMTVAGVAVAIAGVCVSKIVITTLGTVVAVAGGVMLYNESKK